MISFLFDSHTTNTQPIHRCTPAGKNCFQLGLPSIKHFMSGRIRQRFRILSGTDKESLLMDLAEYGISVTRSIYFMGGEVSYESFLKWMDERIPIEAEREVEFKLFLSDHNRHLCFCYGRARSSYGRRSLQFSQEQEWIDLLKK